MTMISTRRMTCDQSMILRRFVPQTAHKAAPIVGNLCGSTLISLSLFPMRRPSMRRSANCSQYAAASRGWKAPRDWPDFPETLCL